MDQHPQRAITHAGALDRRADLYALLLHDLLLAQLQQRPDFAEIHRHHDEQPL